MGKKLKAIVTGDIVGFTDLKDSVRLKTINEVLELLKGWTKDPGKASVFRGDSFQFMVPSVGEALRRSIQMRCWLRMNAPDTRSKLDARMVIGFGQIAYLGPTILESDGEAFHLSGRAFDELNESTRLAVVTNSEALNDQFEVILALAEVIVKDWTASQCAVLYYNLEDKTQQEIAAELKIGQPAVHNRLKLANWKPIAKMCDYIDHTIQYYDIK